MNPQLFLKLTFVCINRMGMLRIFFIALFSVCITSFVPAQKIFYSPADKQDSKTMDFDIIGKFNNQFLIHKSDRNQHNITIYDSMMKEVAVVKLDFLPEKILSTDIITYHDFFYLFYQYQKHNIVYCAAAKFNAEGKLADEPKVLDTTNVNFFANNKLYSIINSDDKQRIMVFKINSKNVERGILTASLFDASLQLLHKSHTIIAMSDKNDFLSEFVIGNDGQFGFVKASGSSQEDNITNAVLITMNAGSDTLMSYDLDIPKIYLDDIKVKVDNVNRRYLLTSFYAKAKRGNIDGLYCILWDKQQAKVVATTNTTFSEDFRNEAKSEGSSKTAFNDFYIQNILVRKDGGFALAAESVYSSSRGVYNNRWDYYSPYFSPYNYYYYSWNSPLYYNSYYYPWWRYGGYPTSQLNRYFADNIAVMSFDSTGELRWTNVIHKSQYDDNSDSFLGYGTLNTGSQFHFLFNQLEHRTLLLSDEVITPDGQIIHSPTLHNLDKEYQFMPRLGKQVSSHELIVPCQYRNFICFAKVEF
jgi:hypothetical protein